MNIIEISKITPHPDNPRRELGDLTELAASIKEHGILQNLTLVPWVSRFTGQPGDDGSTEGKYTVVIGHRRLAAAQLAGLAEVPCTISDMDLKTQVATMLLENMQRNDLTLAEQAAGFQMMLDLGATMEDITQKTGLSESTVRRRVKLLELDTKKLEAAFERGGTLNDYAQLDKVKDPKLKNKVLETIGTNNFSWQLNTAINEEKIRVNKPLVIKELEEFAVKLKEGAQPRNAEWVQHISLLDPDTIKKPGKGDKREYVFVVSGHSISLYRKNEKGSGKKQESEAEKKAREKKKALEAASAQAFELRRAFVEGYSGAKKDLHAITCLAVWGMLNGCWVDADKYFAQMGIEAENDDYQNKKKMALLMQHMQQEFEKPLLALAWTRCGDDGKRQLYYNPYRLTHEENDVLDLVYFCFEELGYQTSDDEKALRCGTHELFKEDKP